MFFDIWSFPWTIKEMRKICRDAYFHPICKHRSKRKTKDKISQQEDEQTTTNNEWTGDTYFSSSVTSYHLRQKEYTKNAIISRWERRRASPSNETRNEEQEEGNTREKKGRQEVVVEEKEMQLLIHSLHVSSTANLDDRRVNSHVSRTAIKIRQRGVQR